MPLLIFCADYDRTVELGLMLCNVGDSLDKNTDNDRHDAADNTPSSPTNDVVGKIHPDATYHAPTYSYGLADKHGYHNSADLLLFENCEHNAARNDDM